MELVLLGINFGIVTLELCPYTSGTGMFICENCYKEDYPFFLEFLGRWCFIFESPAPSAIARIYLVLPVCFIELI